MRRLFLLALAATTILGVPPMALADAAYDRFQKNQSNNFKWDKAPENCPLQKMQAVEAGNKILYELCMQKGRPIYLRASNDDIVIAFYGYRRGQLVQIYNPDHFSGVGFRQGQAVVTWNDENQTVNWQLSSQEKAMYQDFWRRSQQIVKKIGIR